MSVAAKITTSDVKTYLRRTQPEWNINRKQIHVACPIHGGVRDSFSMNTETGQWFCNSACGEGGDIVTLEQKLRGGVVGEAIKRVEEIIGTTYADKPSKKMNIARTYSYHDEDGRELFQVVRLEPKDFRQRHMGPDNKWVWNLQGVRMVPYRLPQLRNASGAVFFVEGEKDVDRLTALGLTATTNPGGAGKWRTEYAKYFSGKIVWVIADDDEAKLKGVRYPGQQHAAQVMRSLLAVAKKVMLIELPDGKDVSDFLDKHGPDGFGAVANCATQMTQEKLGAYEMQYANVPEPEPEPQPVQQSLIEVAAVAPPLAKKTAKKTDGRHPNAIGLEILERHKLISRGRESIWEYNDIIWKRIDPRLIQRWALEAESSFATKRNRRTEIADFIATLSHCEEIPWRQLAGYEVPVLSGVVNLLNGEVRRHRPEDYLEAVMPINYDPTATCPTWTGALEVTWRGDVDIQQKTSALQEFFGYVLMAHALYKKALLLNGQPDSGKSLILSLLQAMVGRENCCSISVEDMDDPRKRAPIRGKMLNSMSELGHMALIKDGGFKQLVSTGDAIEIDAKYEQPEMYIPYAKHVIVTNTLPRVNDFTDATFNRIMLLKFNRSLAPEEKDVNILNKLIAEAPGILNWALAGAKRLYENNGEFTTVPESVEAMKQYKAQSNSANDFMHLYCRKSEGNNIPIQEFRERFNAFRRSDSLSLTIVRRMVKAALGKDGSMDDWFIHDYTWKNN